MIGSREYLRNAFPALLELAQGEGHDDEDCPQDDTCRCPTAAKLNRELNVLAELGMAFRSKLDLGAITIRADLATPGPWGACLGSGLNQCTALMNEANTMVCDFLPDWLLSRETKLGDKNPRPDHIPDLVFVEHARQDVPDLVKEIRRILALIPTGQVTA